MATKGSLQGISNVEEDGPLGLPKHLRRGIRLRELLSSFGKILRLRPDSLPREVQSQLHLSSMPVEVFDFFLSHSWRSSGFMKYTAALLRFMQWPAMAAGTVVALAVMSFQLVHGPLPGVGLRRCFGIEDTPWHQSPWEVLAGVLIGFLVMLFGPWARIGTAGFLDCACINQTNEEVKVDGVRHLGGFLRNSEELIVLWDESYFTRGWCVYELAMYKVLHMNGGKVTILPIELHTAIFGLQVWFSCVVIGYTLLISFLPPGPFWRPLLTWAHAWPCNAVEAYVAETYLRTRALLLVQLENFSMQKAEVAVEEDRILIHQTIKDQFPGGIEGFNEYVRTELRQVVIDTLASQRGPIPYNLGALMCWPFAPFVIGFIGCFVPVAPTTFSITIMIYYVGMVFTIFPSVLAIIFAFMERVSAQPAETWPEVRLGRLHWKVAAVTSIVVGLNDFIHETIFVELSVGRFPAFQDYHWLGPLCAGVMGLVWLAVTLYIFGQFRASSKVEVPREDEAKRLLSA